MIVEQRPGAVHLFGQQYRTIPCGSVIADSCSRRSARCLTSGLSPSAPLMTIATSRPTAQPIVQILRQSGGGPVLAALIEHDQPRRLRHSGKDESFRLHHLRRSPLPPTRFSGLISVSAHSARQAFGVLGISLVNQPGILVPTASKWIFTPGDRDQWSRQLAACCGTNAGF